MSASAERSAANFREWAKHTNAHGFSDFILSRSKIKQGVWLLLILICHSIMYNQLRRGYVAYSKHEWKVSIEEKPKTEYKCNSSAILGTLSTFAPASISKTSNVWNSLQHCVQYALLGAFGCCKVPFPILILCNVNRLKYSKTKEYGMTPEMISFLFGLQNVFIKYRLSSNYSVGFKEFSNWRKEKNFTYMEIFDRMAPTCEDIFLEDVCNNNNYKIIPIDTIEYGRCYKYYPPPGYPQTTDEVGSKGGMALKAQLNEYLPTMRNNHLGVGLALQISYTGVVELGQWIILNPGVRTSVAIRVVEQTVRESDRTFWDPLSFMDSEPPCGKNLTSIFSKKESEYSLASCRRECFFLEVLKNCRCVPFVRSDVYRTCEADEIEHCFNLGHASLVESEYGGTVLTATTEERDAELADEAQKCAEKCGVPCHRRYLETQTSTMRMISAEQIPELEEILTSMNNITIKIDIKDMIMLDIHFSSLSVKVYELYEVMSFDNLISSSGGLMGLWAGMSFLTLIQAVSYFVKFFRNLSLGRKKTRSDSIGKQGRDEIQGLIREVPPSVAV